MVHVDEAVQKAISGGSVWLSRITLAHAEEIRDSVVATGADVICEILNLNTFVRRHPGDPDLALEGHRNPDWQVWAIRVTRRG